MTSFQTKFYLYICFLLCMPIFKRINSTVYANIHFNLFCCEGNLESGINMINPLCCGAELIDTSKHSCFTEKK